jgi:hypothetical protein
MLSLSADGTLIFNIALGIAIHQHVDLEFSGKRDRRLAR